MIDNKDNLIIQLGDKLTEAAKLYAAIIKDHTPEKQSVEKVAQEVFGQSSVTVSAVSFICTYCEADVKGPFYFNEQDPSSEYWKCSNTAQHCSGAVQGKKLKDDGTPFMFPPTFNRYYFGNPNTPAYNKKPDARHFKAEWEQILQDQKSVNESAASPEEPEHPFDTPDEGDTLNADDIF